jgi:hypothetical protein
MNGNDTLSVRQVQSGIGHTVRMHHTYCTHALYTLYACTVHTVRMHYTHCTHALYTLYSCTIHTILMHYTHCTHALYTPYSLYTPSHYTHHLTTHSLCVSLGGSWRYTALRIHTPRTL